MTSSSGGELRVEQAAADASEGLKEGNTIIVVSTGQVVEVIVASNTITGTNTPSGTPDATTTPVNVGTPNEKLDANVSNDVDYC
nr:hypothetical protein [Tanacetum cinerariifolium]